MMRKPLATAIALLAFIPGARAQLITFDPTTFAQVYNGVQQATSTAHSALQTVNTLENVPRELIGQLDGLVNSAISNPLGDITGSLNGLRTGIGSGTCGGSQGILSTDQFYSAAPLPIPGGNQIAQGVDLAGSLLNNRANSNAGVLACNQQMLQATQQRMTDVDAMINQLKGCADITCINGVSGQVQAYQVSMQNQQLQATLVGQQWQLMQATRELNAEQYLRASEAQVIQNSGGAGAIGGGAGNTAGPDNLPVAGTVPVAPTFGTNGFGGAGG